MKRVVLFLTMIVMLFAFTSCNKEDEVDNSINAMFFTSNSGASAVTSLKNLTEGQKLTQPEDPTKEGYVFAGWYKDYYKTELWNFDTDTVGNESFVLYADWKPSIFQITYELYGGVMPNNDYVTEFRGGEFGVLPIPSLEGFEFLSWYDYEWKDSNGEATTIPGDNGYHQVPDVFEDVTLYAHWKPIVVDVKLRVNYPGENSPTLSSNRMNVNYGDIIDFPILEDTDEYAFLGWNSKKDGTGKFYNNGDAFERKLRTTLYAAWDEK